MQMNNSSSIPMESSDPVLFADDGTFLVHKRTCRSPPCLDVELVVNDGHYVCPKCGLIGDRVYHEDLFANHGGGAHAQKDKSVYQLMHGVKFNKTTTIDSDAEILLGTEISSKSFHRNKNSADARDEDADRKFGQFSRRFKRYDSNDEDGDDDGKTNKRRRKNNSTLSVLQEAQASTKQYSSRAWGVFFKERMDSISDALLDAAVILGQDGEDAKSLKTGWLARALHIMCTFIWKTTQLKKRQDVVASVIDASKKKNKNKKNQATGGDELDQYRLESKRAEVSTLINKATGMKQLLSWDNEKEILEHVTNTIAEQLAPSLTKRRGGGRAYVRAYLAIALASCRRALGECHSSLMPWRLAVKSAGRCKSTMSRYDMRIAEQVGMRPWTRLESLIGQCMFYLDLFPKLAGYVPADIDAMRVVRHVYTATRGTVQQHVAKKKKKERKEGEMTNQEYKQCLARIAGHFDELVVRLRAEHENDGSSNNNNNKQKRPALSEVKIAGPLDRKMPHQDRIITAVIAYLTLHHRLHNYKFRHASNKLSLPNGSTSLAKDLEVRHEVFCARVQMELSTFRACLQNLDAYFLLPIVKQQPSPMAWVEGTSVNDFGD